MTGAAGAVQNTGYFQLKLFPGQMQLSATHISSTTYFERSCAGAEAQLVLNAQFIIRNNTYMHYLFIMQPVN